MYDIIIVGMGISGLTAGIYAQRSNKKVLMIDKMMLGGLLNSIDKVSNYPGLPDITGSDFSNNLKTQVDNLEIPYVYETVKKMCLDDEVKKVITDKNVYEAKKVILAMGRSPKFLKLDNEDKLIGKGISTCALCDGYFYRGKDIIVVGTGDSAFQESLYLSNIVNHIYILGRGENIRANKRLIDEVNNKENIEIIKNVHIIKYNIEDEKLVSVTLDNNQILNTDGIFMYIGFIPNTFILDESIKDKDGYIIVNEKFETSIKGVYAVGDIIKKDTYQLISAASDGARVITNMD